MMPISPIVFEAYLKCPTKCFLRSRGEAGLENSYAGWVRSQNELYRTSKMGVSSAWINLRRRLVGVDSYVLPLARISDGETLFAPGENAPEPAR